MSNIAKRLANERHRLSLTQDEFASAGGVSKRAYCNYENGSRDCGAEFLSSVAKVGVDVQFTITGINSANLSAVTNVLTGSTAEQIAQVCLSERAALLLANYEKCTIAMKDAVDRTVRSLANRNDDEMLLGALDIGESLRSSKK
jgi:transcriptional regulator with XRE-family HTH domain